MMKISNHSTQNEKSLLSIDKPGLTLALVFEENGDLFIRILNAEGDAEEGLIDFEFHSGKVQLVELKRTEKEELQVKTNGTSYSVNLSMPQFSIRTLKLSGF